MCFFFLILAIVYNRIRDILDLRSLYSRILCMHLLKIYQNYNEAGPCDLGKWGTGFRLTGSRQLRVLQGWVIVRIRQERGLCDGMTSVQMSLVAVVMAGKYD